MLNETYCYKYALQALSPSLALFYFPETLENGRSGIIL